MQRQVVGALFAVGLVVAGSAAAMSFSSDATETGQGSMAAERSIAFTEGFSDEAAMVLLGTALIGLAGAVKRAA